MSYSVAKPPGSFPASAYKAKTKLKLPVLLTGHGVATGFAAPVISTQGTVGRSKNRPALFFASPMADGVNSVAALLYATLDPAPEKRQAAEAGLAAGALQQGYALALTQAMLAPDLPPGLKQAAALALKLFVKVRALRSGVAGRRRA